MTTSHFDQLIKEAAKINRRAEQNVNVAGVKLAVDSYFLASATRKYAIRFVIENQEIYQPMLEKYRK